MSEELYKIEAELRDEFGKGACRKIRRNGMIPANLMEKGKATALKLNPKLLPKAYKAGKKFDMVLNGETRTVTVKELQVDKVKRTPLHVDLMYA